MVSGIGCLFFPQWLGVAVVGEEWIVESEAAYEKNTPSAGWSIKSTTCGSMVSINGLVAYSLLMGFLPGLLPTDPNLLLT